MIDPAEVILDAREQLPHVILVCQVRLARVRADFVLASVKRRRPVIVPTALAVFPPISCMSPASGSSAATPCSGTPACRGGHFAAFEEPELLADDITTFFATIEQLDAAGWIARRLGTGAEAADLARLTRGGPTP